MFWKVLIVLTGSALIWWFCLGIEILTVLDTKTKIPDWVNLSFIFHWLVSLTLGAYGWLKFIRAKWN